MNSMPHAFRLHLCLVAVFLPSFLLVVGALFGWTVGPMLEVVEKYKETLKKYPNPPAASLTKF